MLEPTKKVRASRSPLDQRTFMAPMPQPTRRVLHIISHLEKGGAEKQLRLLVAASRHWHVIAVLGGNECECQAQLVTFPDLGPVTIYRVVRRAIRDHDIDVVQLWLPARLTVPAMCAARAAGVPILSGDRRKPRPFGRYWLYDRIDYVNYFASDIIVPNYPKTDGKLSLWKLLGFSRKMEVVFNGMQPSSQKEAIVRLPRRLLFVGRLVAQKCVDLLIRAFARCRDELGLVELAIVGEGPQRKELESLAERVDERRMIKFFGSQSDWGRAFSPNDYFLVLPSNSEGMSNTVFEAMDFGFLPIVCASKELDEILRQTPAQPVFFRVNSVDDLCRALGESCALDSAQLAERVAALRAAAKAFSVERMAASYDAIYERL